MLDISNGKIVRVIFLAREFQPESPRVADYIAGLNADEQVSLVAVMWIGRSTYDAAELAEAVDTARAEATAPAEDYLGGVPELAEHLENGMEILGLDVRDEEDHLRA